MVYIVGHRGAPTSFPENTIESFRKAIEFGVDFIVSNDPALALQIVGLISK
jgi:hypothetical protein